MKYIKTFEKFGEIDHNKLFWDLGLTAGRGTTRLDLEIEDDEEKLPLEDDEEHLPLEDSDDDDLLPED